MRSMWRNVLFLHPPTPSMPLRLQLIRPIVRGYSAAIESAVCAMHGTEGPQMSRGTAGAGSEPSPFVGTLVEVLAKSNADLFSRLSPPIKASQPTLGLAVALHLASRCLTLLVRHACILR